MGSLATLAPADDGTAPQLQKYCAIPLSISNTSSKMEKREKRRPLEGSQDMVTVVPSLSRKKRKKSHEKEEDDNEDDGDDYNDSDNEEDEMEISENSGSDNGSDSSSSEDDRHEGNMKEYPDSTAFGRAFRKIMKKKVPETTFTEAMGPMLCAHKNLAATKLEEMAALKESKTEKRREKKAIREKGHTPITVYPAEKDRELIKLATRGVVKLFNAVSKAQSVQETAKVLKVAETKEVAKRSKTVFLSTLQGSNAIASEEQKKTEDLNKKGIGQPAWPALQDSFMLGKSKLKDWDKKQDDDDMDDLESSDDDSQ